jgi:hypothetical protein
MAKGRVDLNRIQRASSSVEGVSKDGLSVQDSFERWRKAKIRTMNWHKTTTFEHHALREGLLVMVDIIQREISQIWGKLICGTVIGLEINQRMFQNSRTSTYYSDGALEGDSQYLLARTLVNMQRFMSIELGNGFAKRDTELVC